MSIRLSPNSREVIGAISTITSKQEYLTSTNGALNINGSFNLSGQAIPASGLTTAVAVQIVDGSGNQIASFGGGTQYTDGGVPPTHPIGTMPIFNNAGTWSQISNTVGLPVNIVGGGGSGGTSSNFGSSFPSAGTAIGATDGTNMQSLKVDGSKNLLTAINVALPAGTNVIGHVITDTGSTTAVTGTVTVSGTVTANAGTNLNTSLLALESGGNLASIKADTDKIPSLGQALAASSVPVVLTAIQLTALTPPAAITNYALETGGNLATLAGTVTSSVLQTNTKQINGIVPLMGNGVTGTGSQRVTIASDNTAFSVNATLSAETTKVIGVVRNADGSGNLLTSTANALDINIKSGSIANTTFAVTQGTAANLNATVVGTGTFAVQATLSAETTKVIGTVNQGTSPWVISGSLTANQSVNMAQINGVTPLMGNGVTGTGSQRVTIASDNTAFSVNATLSAETTKVIGVTRSADGSGNLLTSTSNALDVNLKTSSITLNTSDAVTSTVTPADKTGSGTISALNGTVVATTNGCSIVSFNILGTWSATLLVEGTIDAGSTWIAIDADVDATDTIINNTTVNGLVTVNCASYNQVRLRANPYTSGTANITWSANQGLSLVEVFNTNGNSLRVQDLASGTTGATAPTSAQMQGNLAKTALPTATTDGQLTSNMGDKFGRSVMLNNAIRDIMGTQTTTITASVSETTIITQVASTFLDLVSIFISNTSATAVSVSIRDTTAGSVIFTLYIPAGDMRGISLTTPWPQTTVNTNWSAQSSSSVTSLVVSALYIKNK